MNGDGEVPDGWAEITLGNVINGFQAGRNLRAQGRRAEGNEHGVLKISAVTWGSFRPEENKALLPEDQPKDHERIRQHDLLISRANTSDLVGAVVLADRDYPRLMLPDKILRLLANDRLVDRSFLLHALRTAEVRTHFADNATGTSDSMRNLAQPKIAAAPIRLAPLPEQHRIVEQVEALLTQVNKAKDRLDRVKVILKRFRQSVLAAACSGKLTEEWRSRNGLNGSDESDLPATWRKLTLEQVASDEPRSIQSGPFGSNLRHSEFQDAGRLVIGIDNVADGRFVKGRQNRISAAKFKELEKYVARPLDVLITVMGTVGRCCMVPSDIEPAIITKHVYRISTNHRLMVPEFLLSVLRGSPELRGDVTDQIRGQTRPGINGEILKGLSVPVPPLEEQAEIVRIVQRMLALADTIEARLTTAQTRAEKLPQSILSKAFEGELVPTEADLARAEGRSFESAEEMLKRVKSGNGPEPAAKRTGFRRRGTA